MSEEEVTNVSSNGATEPVVVNELGYSESDWDEAIASLGDIEGLEKKRITPDKEVKERELVTDSSIEVQGAENSAGLEKSTADNTADATGDTEEEGDNSSFLDEILNGNKDTDATASSEPATDNKDGGDGDDKQKEIVSAEPKPLVPEDLEVFIKDIIDAGVAVDKDIKEQFDTFPDDLKMMAKLVGIGMQRYGTGSHKADDTKAELEQKIASVEERMKVLESREQSLKAQEEKLAREAWDNEVEKAVPNWRNIINKDKRFPDWFKRQGGWIKDALTKPNEPSVVIEAMQKFINDTGAADKRIKQEQNIYSGNDRSSSRSNDKVATEKDMWEEAVKAAHNSRSLY